jgi:uncharacterized MAPEG superfamily protein
MASLFTALGLRAPSNPARPTPNHAPSFLIFHFALAYLALAPRNLKQFYGLDHNVAPREDLSKYGDAAVRAGKITQRQLDMMRRTEAAQANAVENLVLFVGAMSLATCAGVKPELVNRAGLTYSVARIVYGVVYVLVDKPLLSQVRGLAWWTGNLSCLWLLWKTGRKMNPS